MSWYNPATWWIDQDNLDAGNRAYEKSQEKSARTRDKISSAQGTDAAAEYWRQVEAQSEGQIVSIEEAEDQVTDAFKEGWSEAVDERKGQFNSAITGLLGSLPWTVWVALGVALFFWMGGPIWLQGALKKR